jgi:hypothetical protein
VGVLFAQAPKPAEATRACFRSYSHSLIAAMVTVAW